MALENKFKIRFVRPNEMGRLSQLIAALQNYQNMKGVASLPSKEELEEDLTRHDEQGELIANNKGTFVAVAVDKSKTEENHPDQSYIVGYLIYTQGYSTTQGRLMYINSFFIEEAYRRHGLGKKFMRFFGLHARLLGNEKFDVPFMKNNHNGQSFYKKMGAYLVDDEYQLSLMHI
jgi:ribosomal protein S18 acetylase RimI-like enzyme